MKAVLDAGIEQLSLEQTVVFTLFSKVALSADGSVFWVATPQTLTVKGSLHVATDRVQDEDQTIGVSQVLLTSEAVITEFLTIAPGSMWIGAWPMGPSASLQVAFAQRASLYRQADVYHYSGHAVYPALSAQLVSSAANLPVGPIVSNSLPIWLLQTTYQSWTSAGVTTVTVPVYPSFLVPDNVVPPYVVAHVEPTGTANFGNFPVYGAPTLVPGPGSPFYTLSASQLSRDEVDFTLYGFTNLQAWEYLVALQQFSFTGPGEAPTFGFANVPAIADAKRTQVELATVAMKKTFHVSANYYQGTANAYAYRYILNVLTPSVTVGTLP